MENIGIRIMGEPPRHHGPISIIVVGLNRSGTSAIGAALHALGVHLGDKFHPPIYEDSELAHAFREKRWRHLQGIIRAYEAGHSRFAWKLPDSHKHLARIHRYFTNPRYIFVYRDIFAIALRRESALKTETTTSLTRCLESYAAIVKFIKEHKPYGLHVSYEKLLQNKRIFAQLLCRFCELPADPDALASIESCITPSPDSYLHWTDAFEQGKRLERNGCAGHLDVLNDRYAAGWAIDHNDSAPAKVAIAVNQQLRGRAVADLPRPDLVQARVSAHGMVGFHYEFGDRGIAKGDVVSVRIEDSDLELVGSPRQLL